MRIILIVSKDRSDKYFANCIAAAIPVVGIVVEDQSKERLTFIEKVHQFFRQPDPLIKKLFSGVIRRWRKRFAVYNLPGRRTNFGEPGKIINVDRGIEVYHTRPGQPVNSPDVVSWIRKKKPDVMAVCGASILSKEVIDVAPHGVLNLHGGLSQCYRGLLTTEWAIHDTRPECVGATVHFVSSGVDDGHVVYQARPELSEDDSPNNCYEKVVKLGVRLMIRALNDVIKGHVRSEPLREQGKLCLAKDATALMRKKTWKRYKQGVIRKYVLSRGEGAPTQLPALINPFYDTYE